MGALTLIDTQHAPFGLAFVDKAGLPTQDVDAGSLAIATSDPELLDVAILDQALFTGDVAASGKKLGTAQVTVTCTSGEGANALTAIGDVTVIAGDAVSEALVFGTPVEKP